jgi:hypothetical protein
MTVSVLLDTSFLITLVDQKRFNHDTAGKYYRLMLEQQVPMYFSAIVAAEFGIKQPITDLPLKNFRPIPFNIPHGKEAARLWNLLGTRDRNTPRHVARDDVKLIAQAFHESIPFILTEDASTLHKYCDRLQVADQRQIRAITLAKGFDPSAFHEDGQRGFSLKTSPPLNEQ